MLNNPAQKPWADATRVILPIFKDGGTHVNLSGVVLAKHSPNKANAMRLIEWLVGEKAQQLYADMVFEYPVRVGVPVNKLVEEYGPLRADPMPIAKIATRVMAGESLADFRVNAQDDRHVAALM